MYNLHITIIINFPQSPSGTPDRWIMKPAINSSAAQEVQPTVVFPVWWGKGPVSIRQFGTVAHARISAHHSEALRAKNDASHGGSQRYPPLHHRQRTCTTCYRRFVVDDNADVCSLKQHKASGYYI